MFISEKYVEEASRLQGSIKAAGVWGALGGALGTYKSLKDKKDAKEELVRLHDTLSKAKDPATKQYINDKIAKLSKVVNQSTIKGAAKSAAISAGIGAIDGAIYSH